MIILNQDKLIKFREKLYTKKVAKLLRQGGKGLNPLGKYKKDEKGRTLVPVREILRFFFRQIEKAGSTGSPLTNHYISALHSLLEAMSRGAEPISFDCGFSISLEEIRDADNKTAIKLLTTNIIITYFNTLKTHKGKVNTSLLSPDLNALISKSKAGTDYTDLINNSMDRVIQSIEEEKPWQESLENLNDADLICRLAGTRLPAIKKENMARLIGQSRREILGDNEVFTKILITRSELTLKERNKKIFLKSMEKLDAATLAILKKTDNYLFSAHRLMQILNLSYQVVLGKTDAQLKQNLVWIFLDAKPGKTDRSDRLKDLGISPVRYRLNMLFNFPDITRYCRSFKTTEEYRTLFFNLFRMLFNDVTGKLAHIKTSPNKTGLDLIRQNLREIARAVENLGVGAAHIKDEKLALEDTYLGLIQKVDFVALTPIMEICDLICRATQDQTREIMSRIRPALVNACFSNLKAYAQKAATADRPANNIKKQLNAYAAYYKPQREFYRIFFDTYLGFGSTPVSPHLTAFINTNNHFAAALLKVYSDETGMKDLISADRISHAATLLDQIRQNK